jgi:hypothetical protein
MISHNTFESAFRGRLLDLLFGQWSVLGSPFSNRGSLKEVIDPEALLCCSLEFLPTEPRLAEAVSQWIRANRAYLVRQRVYRQLGRTDPRAIIWQALDHSRTPRVDPEKLTETCHGLASPADLLAFARRLEENANTSDPAPLRMGRKLEGPATLLLGARDLLGHDIRHFLLVYLLALPHGGRLRDLRAWSGHSYRSLSDAADRWKTAGIVTLDSGYCRLLAPEPFKELLKERSEEIILVNWLTVFETSVRLLRDLAKASSKGFASNGPIPAKLQHEAAEKLERSSPRTQVSHTSVGELLNAFPTLVRPAS